MKNMPEIKSDTELHLLYSFVEINLSCGVSIYACLFWFGFSWLFHTSNIETYRVIPDLNIILSSPVHPLHHPLAGGGGLI